MPLSGNLRSITFMLCTVAMFSCMDAMLKILSSDYPAAQVTAMRGWASLPLVCIYIAWRREFHRKSPVNTVLDGCGCQMSTR